MRSIRNPKTLQRLAREWQRSGRPIGFVPTMGALHEGHLSLVHEARRRVGPDGIVVVSIYVNPTQFGPAEDLSRYPRPLSHDRRLCRAAGVDVLFLPDDAVMYPGRDSGGFTTWVAEDRLTARLEGAARPTHFRGVTTIVAKLFHCVLPDLAVFGAKDWQQAAVIRRMVDNLDFPVRVVVAPTVREPDGLAMSSRNRYLDREERAQATVLWEAIRLARSRVRGARRPVPAGVLTDELTDFIHTRPAARVDYVAFIDGTTLEPVERVTRGTHLALAVRIGRTRLIDNARL